MGGSSQILLYGVGGSIRYFIIKEGVWVVTLKKTQNSADPDFQTLSHIHPDPYHRGVGLKGVGNPFLRTSIHLLCIKSILRSMFACIFI